MAPGSRHGLLVEFRLRHPTRQVVPVLEEQLPQFGDLGSTSFDVVASEVSLDSPRTAGRHSRRRSYARSDRNGLSPAWAYRDGSQLPLVADSVGQSTAALTGDRLA